MWQRKKAKRRNKNQNPEPSARKKLLHVTFLHVRKKEGSSTARHRLQTFLGDADKQDWMLKE
jgi:hypothetical protein